MFDLNISRIRYYSKTTTDTISENLVAIGSGIGITPAISIFRQYVSTQRRVNMVCRFLRCSLYLPRCVHILTFFMNHFPQIWMCKDAGLVEHFVGNTL